MTHTWHTHTHTQPQFTALHYAASGGFSACVACLLVAAPELWNSKNAWGATPGSLAKKYGFRAVADAIADWGTGDYDIALQELEYELEPQAYEELLDRATARAPTLAPTPAPARALARATQSTLQRHQREACHTRC